MTEYCGEKGLDSENQMCYSIKTISSGQHIRQDSRRGDKMAKPINTAKKLATAINMEYGAHIVINRNEFFAREEFRTVHLYSVRDAWSGNDTEKYRNDELFRTASGIYVCLFMRDMLWTFQGRTVPLEDNPGYNKVFSRNNGWEMIRMMVNRYKVVDEDV